MIRDTLSAAVVDSDVHIVEEKEGRFTECTEKGDQRLTEEEEARIRELFGSGKIYKDPAFAVFLNTIIRLMDFFICRAS